MNEKHVEVVVIGSGLAGLTASVEAARNGATVKILEMIGKIGGNSAKATSGINGVLTREQKKRRSKDTPEIFENDTIKGGHGKNEDKLVKILVNESTAAIEFLEKLNLDLKRLTQCGGHSHARTHRCDPKVVSNNVGKEIIVQVYNHAKKLKGIETSLNSEVIGIEKKGEGYRVTYLKNEEEEVFIDCDSVVIATGGYAANINLITKIFNKPFPTTNGTFSKGSLMRICEELFDADVTNLSDVQLHPTGLVNPSNPSSQRVYLAPEALRAYGGILVNENGHRFVNELSTRDVVMQGILDNCSSLEGGNFCVSNLLLNDFVLERFGLNHAKFYKDFGLLHQYNNGKDFCEREGVPIKELKKTLDEYNNAAIGKSKDRFGKTTFPSIIGFKRKMYRMFVTPAAHYCMGGIRINEKAELISKSGHVLKGLYGAGEVTTGVHGKNRLAGNSLLECVVFGRIAGENAAVRSEMLKNTDT